MMFRLQQSKIPSAIPSERETGLPSFGEKLKQEREKRKITLEQISLSTKIGTRMLQALEEDKFNQLPGGIFNKGFVRAYARSLGLDEDQTVADYLQATGDAPPRPAGITAREESVSRIEADSDVPHASCPGACSPRFYCWWRSLFPSGASGRKDTKAPPPAATPPAAQQSVEDHTAPAATAPGPALSTTSDEKSFAHQVDGQPGPAGRPRQCPGEKSSNRRSEHTRGDDCPPRAG